MVRGRAETVEGTVWCCIKTCMQCAAGWVRASVCLEVEAMAPVYCRRAGGLAAVGATGEKGGPMSKNGLETTTHCPTLELGHGNVFGGRQQGPWDGGQQRERRMFGSCPVSHSTPASLLSPDPRCSWILDLYLYASTSAWISIDLRRQIHQGMFLDTS